MVDTNGTSNGRGHATASPPIPGPLGLEAASLKGKVALVTGSGSFPSMSNGVVYVSSLMILPRQRYWS